MKSQFKVGSARATLRDTGDGTAKLSNVFSQRRGKGHASEVLRSVIEYADRVGLYLWLEVQRYGEPRDGLDNSQLIHFYEKFGFHISDGDRKPIIMERNPS